VTSVAQPSGVATGIELPALLGERPSAVGTAWSARQALVVLGITSGVIVAHEVLMTRLLSVVTWYGMAFFVLSIAMLGLTAGSLEALQSRRAGVPLRDFVAQRSFRLAGAIVFAVVVTLIVPMPADPSLTLQLAVVAVAAANTLPMAIGGSIVARIMAESSTPIGKTYAIDLTAAAAGALCPLVLLGPLDGVSALLVLAAFPALAGAAIATTGPSRKRMLTAAGVLLAFAGLNNYSLHGLQIRFSKHAFADQMLVPRFVGWNALSNVQATQFVDTDRQLVLWGPSPKTPPGQSRAAHAAIDGEAGTSIHAYKRIEDLGVLSYDITNAVHWIRPTGPACVIGIGGGRDIESALYYGHDSVFAVEINPLMIDMLRQVAAESPILADPRVNIYIGDGRSVIASHAPHCQTLQVSLVDTWAATGAGAFAHTEATLYTREAWSLLLQRVDPGGVLTFSRWYSPGKTSETARLLALAVASLLERGVKNPADHIALIAWSPKDTGAGRGGLATVLVSPTPFSPSEANTIRTRAKELEFDVLTAPGVTPADPILQRILATREIDRLGDAVVAAWLDTSPPTDDRPFFFQLLRPSAWLNPQVMFAAMTGGGVIYGNVLATVQMLFTFVTVALLTVFVLGPPLMRARRDGAALPDGGAAPYFGMLGAGFMLVELALMQRLHVVLGHPTYALVVVLASLLVCTGIGSAFSSRLITTRKAATLATLSAGILLLALPWAIEWFAHATLSSPLSLRILWTGGLTGIVGLVLGMLFPSGIRFIDRDRGLPVALGINGATSVVGSILSMLVSVVFGIAASFCVAAVIYLIAAAVGPHRWRAVA
jgi:SAM-dependent methyltransferase